MSDFLSKFTDENYNREEMILEDSLEIVNDNSIEELRTEIEEEIIESSIENNIDKRYEETNYIRSEETEFDPSFKNKQRKKIALISVISLIVIFITFFLINSSRMVLMPDFANVNKQDVVAWIKKNKMNAIYVTEYNEEIENDYVISQSVDNDTKVKRGSDIKFIISSGADPEEKISVPDFNTMTKVEIEDWVKDNKLRYVQVDYIYSNDIEKDKFIAFDITDKDVNKENFLRKNKGKITISLGVEVFEKNILVIDFNNKTKEDIVQWRLDKGFVSTFVYNESYDDKIPQGNVISQETDIGEKVSKDEVLTFTISKGKAQRVPNYSVTELSSFDTISSDGVMVISKEIFSADYAYGKFISQSIAAGTVMNDNTDSIVIVYYSIGKPYISNLIGKNEGELESYFYDFNGKGANITYTIQRVTNCEPKGMVVDASVDNEYISTTGHIYISISDGKGICNVLD